MPENVRGYWGFAFSLAAKIQARYNAGMNLVAFETSSDTLSVAVTRGETTAAEEVADAGQKNSELTLPLMHKLLAAASLTLAEIDLVAFGQGPGSFTGVRIACGLAQGLAFGLGKPVIGLPSTQVLAAQAAHENADDQHALVIVAIDARMGEVYFAAYQRDESTDTGFVEIVAPRLVKPDQLPDLSTCWSANGTAIGTGSAFAIPALRDALITNILSMLPGFVVPTAPTLQPQAFYLSALANRLYDRQGVAATLHPRDAAPIYLRNNVAMTIDERRQFHAAKQTVVA